MHHSETNLLRYFTRRDHAFLIEKLSHQEFCRGTLSASASGIMSFAEFEEILNTPALALRYCRLVSGKNRLIPAVLAGQGREGLYSIRPHSRAGLSLVTESVDALNEPVNHITAFLSAMFQEKVIATLHYADGYVETPFTEDTSDRLLFQLCGRMRWSVWLPQNGMQELRSGRENMLSCELILGENDFIYLPAGHTYCTRSAAEHSLCVTFTFRHKAPDVTGPDRQDPMTADAVEGDGRKLFSLF